MNILKRISSMLEDKPFTESVVTETPLDPTPETSQEPPKEPSSKDKAFQEAEKIAQKWMNDGVAVSLRDFEDRKAGEQFRIESVGLEKSSQEVDYYWLNMQIDVVSNTETVCLGYVSFGYVDEYQILHQKWSFENLETRDFLVTLEDSKLPQHQKEIEAWKNPQLTFKIRQKEGKPCYTIWFSHNGYTKGIFHPVYPKGDGGYVAYSYHNTRTANPQLLELDSLEAAREVVEILKTREKVEDIAYFTRQFADVSGEFYTVETINPNSKEP